MHAIENAKVATPATAVALQTQLQLQLPESKSEPYQDPDTGTLTKRDSFGLPQSWCPCRESRVSVQFWGLNNAGVHALSTA